MPIDFVRDGKTLFVGRSIAEDLFMLFGIDRAKNWDEHLLADRLKFIPSFCDADADLGEYTDLVDAIRAIGANGAVVFKMNAIPTEPLIPITEKIFTDKTGKRLTKKKKVRKRGEPFSFKKCGIPVGAVLTLKKYPEHTCKVMGDPWWVDFGDGLEESFTQRTRDLLGVKPTTYLSPMHYWLYEGKLLRYYYNKNQRTETTPKTAPKKKAKKKVKSSTQKAVVNDAKQEPVVVEKKEPVIVEKKEPVKASVKKPTSIPRRYIPRQTPRIQTQPKTQAKVNQLDMQDPTKKTVLSISDFFEGAPVEDSKTVSYLPEDLNDIYKKEPQTPQPISQEPKKSEEIPVKTPENTLVQNQMDLYSFEDEDDDEEIDMETYNRMRRLQQIGQSIEIDDDDDDDIPVTYYG